MTRTHTTKCPRCRSSITPDEFAKGPNLRESATELFMPFAAVVIDTFDRRHLRCPKCRHAWRPRLHERHILLQLIAWPILLAGAIIGIGVIWMAVTGQIP
jgi:hypothetical protein